MVVYGYGKVVSGYSERRVSHESGAVVTQRNGRRETGGAWIEAVVTGYPGKTGF